MIEINKPIALLADVHSNLEALETVLDNIRDPDRTELVCLGDVVGYGPNPSECISLLKEFDTKIIAGNHDAAACGKISTTQFNRLASRSADWTRIQLNEEELDYLRDLPETMQIEEVFCAHGTPNDPLMEYLMSPLQAQRAFEGVSEPILAVGHTHQPVCYRRGIESQFKTVAIQGNDSLQYNTDSGENLVINPGSVGQPRDGDPRASYVVIDPGTNRIKWNRIEYPIETVQQKIYDSKLPVALANRLERGQ